jgi:hypothetical protein
MLSSQNITKLLPILNDHFTKYVDSSFITYEVNLSRSHTKLVVDYGTITYTFKVIGPYTLEIGINHYLDGLFVASHTEMVSDIDSSEFTDRLYKVLKCRSINRFYQSVDCCKSVR